MENSIEDLKKNFIVINRKGWIESCNFGTGSVGDTFERMLGLRKNSLDLPDFKGIELKTNRVTKNCYITLFSTSCDCSEKYILYKIKELFGWPDRDFPDTKVLRVKLSAKELTYLRNGIRMKLEIDYKRKIVKLNVYKYNLLINSEASWSFELLKTKLLKKMQYLAFITTENKFLNGKEYFRYKSISFYSFKNFEVFLSLLSEGLIIIEIKFGVHRSGVNIGKSYDHGSSFEIKRENINKLFTLIDFVEP